MDSRRCLFTDGACWPDKGDATESTLTNLTKLDCST